MGICNKYSGNWYDSYKKDRKPTAPYKIVRIENDEGVPIPGLEDAIVEAYSESQAMLLFHKKYPQLKDYIEMGYQIDVELDSERLRQRKQLAELERQRKEKQIQNAWWND